MYLIGIYPLIKGNWTQELQYWSPEPIAPGSIIKAHLRTKHIAGLVFKCLPVHEAKGEIKDADFKTRKIESPHPIHVVRSEYIQAILKASTYFVQNIGAMLKTAIPTCAFDDYNTEQKKVETTNNIAVILNNTQTNQHIQKKKELDDNSTTSIIVTENNTNETPFTTSQPRAFIQSQQKTDIVAISTNTEDRFSTYKSMIREDLARKKSVILVTPTFRTGEALFDSIKKGIEHMTVLIHGSLSKNKLKEVWNFTIQSEKPVIIITTPQFVSIPRMDVETIIVENESSRAYRTFYSPYFDWRKVIENYAKELRAKLVYGDQLLSLETIHRIKTHEVFEIFPISFRIQQDADLIIIDMIEAKQKASKFVLLSEELCSMIEYTHKKNQHMFIFSARRGLSPQTICGDCNTTVVCSFCGAPVVLHKSPQNNERFFLCHHCGKDRIALEACKTCNSWNLNTIGIGSDTIYEEIKKLYPFIPVFKIDKDSAKTDKEALKIVKEFYATPGSILVGTETAFSYIGKVKYSAIASMDNLFSIPDFRINERIAHICLKLFEITSSHMLLQTRNVETSIIKGLETRTLADFVKEELELREILEYSPFTLHGKISLVGEISEVTDQAKRISALLEGYEPHVFPAMIPSKKGSSIHILFKIPKNTWNDERRIYDPLYTTLKTISQITPIHINPESFLS